MLASTPAVKQRLTRASTYLAGAVTLVLVVMTWIPHFDRAASQYLDDALNTNLVVYASARTINAIISVISSVEVSLNFGAGVALHPGEALDPLNDLIERFSGFLLYGLAALGLQQVILVATGSLIAKLLTSCALLGMFGAYVWRVRLPGWLLRMLLLLILVRFVFVLQAGLSWGLDRVYFDEQQRQALDSLDLAKDQLQDLRDSYKQSVENAGFISGAWQTAQAILGTDQQQSITDIAATAIVHLIVILLIRSLLMPLVFLWLVWTGIRSISAQAQSGPGQ